MRFVIQGGAQVRTGREGGRECRRTERQYGLFFIEAFLLPEGSQGWTQAQAKFHNGRTWK